MNTALGLPAARQTTPAVASAAGGFSEPSGISGLLPLSGGVLSRSQGESPPRPTRHGGSQAHPPNAAQSSIGDGGRWTLRHSPAFAAALFSSAMVAA